MKNLFNDIINFKELKKIEKNYKYCFFVENRFIYYYLKGCIQKKSVKNPIIISFEKIEVENNHKVLVFRTIFFQSLFFLLHKFDFFFSSTPDLDNNFFYKKSKNKKCKYIYIQHSPLSLSKIYNSKAFFNFDVIQVVNTFQENEVKEINNYYKKKIRIFKSPYYFIKNINRPKIQRKILVAPTWSTDFYKLNIHNQIFNLLDSHNLEFSFRPHPMSLKYNEISVSEISKLDSKLDRDLKVDFTKYSDLISDWSGIFIEFAIINKKFPILINNRQKIRNNNEKFFSQEPIEIVARRKISHIIDLDNLKEILFFLKENDTDYEQKQIKLFENKYFF